MKPRLAFYACGGGYGHGVRALGLARVCRDLGASVLLLAPARLEPFARWAGIPHQAPPLEPPARPDLREWVLGRLRAFRPDVLVLDVFPRGVLGELADRLEGLAPRRVLVTRHVHPRFYEADGMDRALGALDLVLATEPEAPALRGHPGLRRIPPITLVQAWELSSPRVGFSGGILDLTGPPRILPAALAMPGARAVVAHGGYASYYEILQAGVPAVLCPRARPLDDQFRRARGQFGLPLRARHEIVSSLAEVEGALRRLEGAAAVAPAELGGAREGGRSLLHLVERGEIPPAGSLPGTPW